MTAPIVFPDVEMWAATYLKAALASHGYAGMSVVNVRTATVPQVWVRRDGGPVVDQLREVARLGVNVFATSEQKATDLARTVAALLRAGATGDPVTRVQQTAGPSPIADAVGPRRYMTFEITTRGTEL